MVGSIDPRCETVRGTHWPNEGRVVVWSSRRGNHLGQRSKAPHQQAGHMDASDPIRPSKNSCGTGAVHIWVPARARGPPLARATGESKRQHAVVALGAGVDAAP